MLETATPNPISRKIAEIIAALVEDEFSRVEEEAKGLIRRDGGRFVCIYSAVNKILMLVKEGK